MTNEEMAVQIFKEHDRLGILKSGTLGESVAIDCIVKALNEKDQQIKEYLEKKEAEYMSQRDNANMWSEQWAVFHALACTMHQIINDLFGE